ncbi:MAG: methyltransferase [Lactobacillaceae bacterium]|jgi:tRNA1(Val) A37 N6-methylase TrmN6|nr:methyltransferase [Lactobacillaceae bacterium]
MENVGEYFENDISIDEFQGIKIIQSKILPKYQIDAFLLVDFADAINQSNYLTVDFGAGTGAVGLTYSKKNKGKIILVEIQKELFELEQKSITLNNLQDRVSALNIDIKDISNSIKNNSVDVVISNPPYFDIQSHKKRMANTAFEIARHEIKLELKDLIFATKKILKNKGKFYLIHRSSRILEILELLKEHNFGIENMQFVYHNKNSKSDLVLIKAIKDGSNRDVKILEPKFVEEM